MKIVEVETFDFQNQTHQDLNPALFVGDKLKPEVRERLLEIVNEFCNYVGDDDFSFKIIDIVLVGSQASYNYTIHSDIDLHIIVNMAQICQCCPDIIQKLFNAEKARFNSNYDITVKDIPVEIYVEDVRASTRSNGIYSILRDEWVKVPKQEDTITTNSILDTPELQEVLNEISRAIDSGVAETIQNAINDLYLLRKQGLESEGETSKGNLIFKEIRNRGLLDELKSKYYETRSQELTLEGMEIVEVDEF